MDTPPIDPLERWVASNNNQDPWCAMSAETNRLARLQAEVGVTEQDKETSDYATTLEIDEQSNTP
jgi:hypothetical protein